MIPCLVLSYFEIVNGKESAAVADRWVTAQIVDVAPHLAHVATFAVHRCVAIPNQWIVTHVETGFAVTHGHRARRDAIGSAAATLDHQTPAAMQRRAWKAWRMITRSRANQSNLAAMSVALSR